MNVTIKIEDHLGTQARHRAVDRGLSLSGWVAEIIRKELAGSGQNKPMSLLDSLGNDALAGVKLDFTRDDSTARDLDFRK